jgi:hypothetical protein
LWILALEEEARQRPLPPTGWPDDCQVEREYFGIDHCKVGRWMAVSWNFMPSFLDVFEAHHHPERAQHDPYLVGIIAAADRFLLTQQEAPPDPLAEDPPAEDPSAAVFSAEVTSAEVPSAQVPSASIALPSETDSAVFLQSCLPSLDDADRHALFELLQTEYIHLLPLVQLGVTTAATSS